jgi:hypothetical protein
MFEIYSCPNSGNSQSSSCIISTKRVEARVTPRNQVSLHPRSPFRKDRVILSLSSKASQTFPSLAHCKQTGNDYAPDTRANKRLKTLS